MGVKVTEPVRRWRGWRHVKWAYQRASGIHLHTIIIPTSGDSGQWYQLEFLESCMGIVAKHRWTIVLSRWHSWDVCAHLCGTCVSWDGVELCLMRWTGDLAKVVYPSLLALVKLWPSLLTHTGCPLLPLTSAGSKGILLVDTMLASKGTWLEIKLEMGHMLSYSCSTTCTSPVCIVPFRQC